jgi:hypothetical protein
MEVLALMMKMPAKLGRLTPTKMRHRPHSGCGQAEKREVQLRSYCAFEQRVWHANEGGPMKQRGVFEKEPGSGV